MTLTREFRETVQDRVQRDPAFREALLVEAVQSLLVGDVEVGKTMLRDYINATGGFEKLGLETRVPPNSLIRMFGLNGNLTANTLLQVIAHLQTRDKVRLEVGSAS